MTRKISRASIVVAAAYALFLSLPFWAFTDPPPQPPRDGETGRIYRRAQHVDCRATSGTRRTRRQV